MLNQMQIDEAHEWLSAWWDEYVDGANGDDSQMLDQIVEWVGSKLGYWEYHCITNNRVKHPRANDAARTCLEHGADCNGVNDV